MKVDFRRLTWENYPSTETPVNADNLNRLEEGVAGLYSDVAEIEEELGEGVGEYVTGWLDDHVTPAGSAVIVDDTLTIEGAAADAKKTGDEIFGLKEDISDSLHLLDNNAVDLQNPVFWKGGTISSSGVITTDRAYNNTYTTLITFPIRYGLNNSIYNPTLYLIKYLNGVFVSRTSIGSNKNTGVITPDSTFDSYRLMIIAGSQTPVYTVAQMVANGFKYIESVRKYDEDLESDKIDIITSSTLVSADWFTRGYINNDGNYRNDSTNGAIVSDMIYVPTVLILPSTLQYNICTYSGGVFVARQGWSDGTGKPINISASEYRVIISWRTNAPTDYTVDYTLDAITWFGTKLVYDSTQVSLMDSRLEFINKVNCSWTGSKICHYSVDDTYAVLKDLTDNAETYTSIFDNATLAQLQTIHNSTGLCITLITFNTTSADPSYSIADVPQKAAFQTEFQANKNWLKFAFHAADDTANYNTSAGISDAYDTFVTAIFKLTGDYDCIDRFTRLGFFGGTLANVLTIRDKEHGITGLLCADTTNRDSYYLTTEQNKIVQSKGMYVDTDNQMIMLKTITRTSANMVSEIEGNLPYQKYVELFTHEYETSWLTTVSTMATWLKNNGYVFAFPSEIIV